MNKAQISPVIRGGKKTAAELQHALDLEKRKLETFALAASSTNEILTHIVNAKSRKIKLQHVVSLAAHVIGDKEAIGLIRRKNRVVSNTRLVLSNDQVHLLRKATDLTPNTHIIRLDKDLELVIKSKRALDEGLINKIRARLETLDLSVPRYSWLMMAGLLLTAALFIPINERISAQGTVISNIGYQVAAPSDGMIEKVQIPYGRVEKGQVIASLQNNELLSLAQLQSDLTNVEQKIRDIGAYSDSDSDIEVLLAERRKLILSVKKLETDIDKSQIKADVAGLVEWQPNIVGTYMQKGQIIGAINLVEQSNVEVLINVSDWIALEEGDPAVFVSARDYRRHAGVVASIPTTTLMNEGVAQYQVNVRLDRDLPTGSTGKVVAKGDKTILLFWLMRKQIQWIKAVV